jgi:hypothetical protein
MEGKDKGLDGGPKRGGVAEVLIKGDQESVKNG